MRYIFPDYCRNFSCIAGKCPASCCITDWDIEIDPETKELYDHVEGAAGARIRSLMIPSDDADSGEGSAVIRASSDHRCPFLDRNNLCEIYLALGEDGLSQTCREYPRYFGESGDLLQEDLSLSCPEVSRLFFSDQGLIHYQTESDIMDGDPLSSSEEMLLKRVTAFRDCFIFSPSRAVHIVEKMVPQAEHLPQILQKTESLSPLWDNALDRMMETSDSFQKKSPVRAIPDWACTKLMQYFIFRYSIDVMYGSTFEEILHLTAVSLASIGLLYASSWQPDHALSCRNIQKAAANCSGSQIRLMDAAVLYSRQMEHSEENIETLKSFQQES